MVMRKIQLLGLMVLAAFAISVVAASAASAEVALWTSNGAEIKGAVSTTATGLLNLTDLGAPGGEVTVDCEGALDGYVEGGGRGHVSEVLYLEKKETENLIECEVVKEKAGLCETSMLADVIPIGLPWASQAELNGTGYLNDITSVSGGSLGYMVTCLTILGETLDECTQTLAEQELVAAAGGVDGVAKETGKGNCTLGGNGEGDIEGSGLLTLNGGATLGIEMP
jgi:hypothetical protein